MILSSPVSSPFLARFPLPCSFCLPLSRSSPTAGLPSQQHFHHAFQGVSLDMLNVWLSECPAILDLVHLLFALYYRFSPTLLIQLFNRGGQKFGDVIAGLVTRTSHYYDEFPLKTDPTPGDSFARDQAPEWLKTRVDAVLPLVPADRQPELWDLVNSLRFSKVDVELLKTTKEVSLLRTLYLTRARADRLFRLSQV